MDHISRQIFGLSNSSALFVPSSEAPHYFRLLLSLANKPIPSICYIGAARGDAAQRITEFRELSRRVPCTPKVLNLFDLHVEDISGYLTSSDVIFIDGGSTRNLIALLNEWDIPGKLVQAYRSGVVISGASAGLNILFNWCTSDSIKTRITAVEGIGLLKGAVCVHYDSNPDRRTVFGNMLETEQSQGPAYALDDGTALHFLDDVLVNTYSNSPDSQVRKVFFRNNQIEAVSLFSQSLGGVTEEKTPS